MCVCVCVCVCVFVLKVLYFCHCGLLLYVQNLNNSALFLFFSTNVSSVSVCLEMKYEMK